MARPRKNAAKVQGSLLAPDEVAEIPVEEQPYPLPEGWKWERGNSLWKPQETEKPTGEFFYYIDIDAVDNKQQKVISPKKIPLSQAPSRASRKLHEGDTIFSLVRPYLRNIAYIDEDISSCIASTWFYICSPLKSVNSRFLYWLMTSDYVVLGLNKFMKGDNSPSIRKNDIENFPFPLPPIDEQQRIVDRIESLFAKLDDAKAKAEAVLDSFEIRKAAILHKAFTGELTAKWRDERGVDMKSWEYVNLSTVSRLQTGIMKGKKYIKETQKMPYLRVANVQDGYFDLNEIKEIDLPIDDMNRYLLRKGDVLFTEGGDFDKLGRGAVWNEEIFPCTYQNHIFVVRTDAKRLVPKFLSLQARSQYGKQYFLHCSKQTTNLASINSTQLKNFPLILPSVAEQQELVHILDNLLAKEQQAKEAAETVLHQLKLMKKAILARAFRGELGTHGSARDTLQNNGSM